MSSGVRCGGTNFCFSNENLFFPVSTGNYLVNNFSELYDVAIRIKIRTNIVELGLDLFALRIIGPYNN